MQRLYLTVSAVLLTGPAAFAWNDRGHMLTAMVAYDGLKPEVRAQMTTILSSSAGMGGRSTLDARNNAGETWIAKDADRYRAGMMLAEFAGMELNDE